jgi:peroxiredoxin
VELQGQQKLLEARGYQLVAVTVESSEVLDSWRQMASITYTLLADPTHRVSESYGVYDLGGLGLAGPAVFVIEEDRHVAWAKVGRPVVDEILENLP